MSIKIGALKDEVHVCFEDLGEITYWAWCFCNVKALKDYIHSTPESVGKVFIAEKVRCEINENALKDVLEQFFDEEVVLTENFVSNEAFTVDDLWDKETFGKVKKLLDDMLSDSGYFLKKTDTEVDYSDWPSSQCGEEKAK